MERKLPSPYSLSRVIEAWNLRYNYNVANSLRCIYEIALKKLTYREIETLLKDAYKSIDAEIVDLDMGFDYTVNINGNPKEQLFTPTLKSMAETNLFYSPYCVYIAWFPKQSDDYSLLEINMILYLIRVYSENFIIVESPERTKKIRGILIDLLSELKLIEENKDDLFIKIQKILYT